MASPLPDDAPSQVIGEPTGSWPRLLVIAAAVAALMIAGFVVDVTMAGVRPINERPPSFAPVDQLRSALMVIAALIFVGGVVTTRARAGGVAHPGSWAPLDDAGPTGARVAWMVIVAHVAVTALFLVSPPVYSRLSLEGGPVETLSAWLLFASAGILGTAGWRLRKQRGERGDRLAATLLLFAAFVTFFLGGEEVSWFQRVLDIETPAAFSSNLQGEMNLHNFETNAIEVAYYLATWMAFVALPFVRDHMPFIGRYSVVRLFAPTVTVLAMAAPTAAFNHEQWNQVPAQFMAYATFLILVRYLAKARDPGQRALFGASLAAFVAIQAAYLAYGDRLLRYWEMTEYKETFISLVILVASVHVLRRVRGLVATPARR